MSVYSLSWTSSSPIYRLLSTFAKVETDLENNVSLGGQLPQLLQRGSFNSV